MMSIYKDAKRSVHERVADLLARMTPEGKFAQMHAYWLVLSEKGDHRERSDMSDEFAGVSGQAALTERLRMGVGQITRPLGTHIVEAKTGVRAANRLQKMLDVSRDVRWGRTEETFGEDPWLVGVMACAYVQGLQGEKRDVLATLKHYVGHSFSEGARNHAPVHLGLCELNDTFLLPFEMAVKLANAGSVMPAYHDIDNQPGHSDNYLLTTVLREQWGFDGIIVADYGGVNLLHQHHGVSHDAAQSAALAFNAGLDVELPKDDCARHLAMAVDRRLMTMTKVDEIVSRILTEKFRLGLFEQPYTDVSAIDLQSDEARKAARDVATCSITLLENNGILPLQGRPRVAVIGPTANDPLALLSGYSFPVHLIISDMADSAVQVTTLLAALRHYLGDDHVDYAKGCHIIETRLAGAPVFPGDSSGKPMQSSPVSTDQRLIPEAVAVARRNDVVVVCVGDLAGLFQSGTVGEGSDTDSLTLPGVQQQLTTITN